MGGGGVIQMLTRKEDQSREKKETQGHA